MTPSQLPTPVIPPTEVALEHVAAPGTAPSRPSIREVVEGKDLADLEAIYEPGVQLVTAPLSIPAEIPVHLASARPRWGWRKIVPVDEGDRPDLDSLRSLEASASPGGEALRSTTAEVVEVMATLFGVDALGVRLANATSPPCPRFHVDKVQVRGVLTLVGRGSEYFLSHEVDRARLGHGAGGKPDESSGLIAAGAQPRPLSGGHLCLFKGEAWTGNQGHALVHRSPPEDGRPRWVMTVDLV